MIAKEVLPTNSLNRCAKAAAALAAAAGASSCAGSCAFASSICKPLMPPPSLLLLPSRGSCRLAHIDSLQASVPLAQQPPPQLMCRLLLLLPSSYTSSNVPLLPCLGSCRYHILQQRLPPAASTNLQAAAALALLVQRLHVGQAAQQGSTVVEGHKIGALGAHDHRLGCI